MTDIEAYGWSMWLACHFAYKQETNQKEKNKKGRALFIPFFLAMEN